MQDALVLPSVVADFQTDYVTMARQTSSVNWL
jgi:hypothetical protein